MRYKNGPKSPEVLRAAMADSYVLEIPEQVTIVPSTQRVPQAATRPWPAGTVIVSADSHLIEQDYWFEGFPEDKKDQAPRMVFADGRFNMSIGDKPMTPPELATFLCQSMECTPGLNDVQARLKDPWIKPYTDEVIAEMPKKGIKRVLAFSPAFVADCLETTVEVGREFREIFEEAGGEHWQLAESLNTHPLWIETLKDMVLRS